MRSLFRGLRPTVFWLGLTSFFTDVASEMVFPLMPYFLTTVLHASRAMLGTVEGSADALSALLRIVSGWMSDRAGKRKPFIFWGYTLSAATRPFYALATAPWHVLTIRLSDRLGKGTRLAARDALIADSAEKEARGRAYGLQNAMDMLGAAVGPIIAWQMLRHGMDLKKVFLFTAVPGAMVMAVIALLVRDVPKAGEKAAPPRLSLAPFGGNFRWFLLTIFVFTIANSSDVFLADRMPSVGIAVEWVPVWWAGFNVARGLAALPLGALADHVDKRWCMLAGWVLYAATYAGFAMATGRASFLGCLAAYTLFNGLSTSVQRAVVADLVPKELRGTAFGLFYFAIGLASLPSSWLFGKVADLKGAPAAFGMDAAVAVVACLMLLAVRKPAGAAPPAS